MIEWPGLDSTNDVARSADAGVSMIMLQYREEIVPALKVNRIVDATGAGDAFVSGFLAGVPKGLDPFEAVRLGNAVVSDCADADGASTATRPLGEYLNARRSSATTYS
jgi:sugar/nucleoside kinase (ribokinase family)